MIETGQNAPNFTLPNSQGEQLTLDSLRGNYVLLYFYPKDDSPGCTIEAQALRDLHEELVTENVVILGISSDDVNSHARFKKKHDLPFNLLADPTASIIKLYGAADSENRANRISYLIDPDGIVIVVYSEVSPAAHAQEVLQDVKNDKSTKNQ